MSKKYMITGGAGFIGSNYADRLIGRGENVLIYDNLSRAGAPINIEWLQGKHGEGSFQLVQGDVENAELIAESALGVDVIVHLAGQVAVTRSVLEPRHDFESNALGTFNVLEAARTSGKNTAVIYASTNKVYGPRQFGIEDQGWVAWFLIASETGIPLTIYGNGKQVRDVLHVEDLLEAYDAGIQNIDSVAGQAFNIGGGPQNTISIWQEFGPLMEDILSKKLEVSFEDWRPGDQRVYISDIRKAGELLGWTPKISVDAGIRSLHAWIHQNRKLFEK